MRCEEVCYNERLNCFDILLVNVSSQVASMFHGKHLVIGIGGEPNLPECIVDLKGEGSNPHLQNLFHSSEYMICKPALRLNSNLTIVGSGQSAAEIFYDLLQSGFEVESLNWFTRADRFYPMEYSKSTLEMTSPDYIDYFYGLSWEKKAETLAGQDMLHKGINFSLINAIYDELHKLSLEDRRSRESLISSPN